MPTESKRQVSEQKAGVGNNEVRGPWCREGTDEPPVNVEEPEAGVRQGK